MNREQIAVALFDQVKSLPGLVTVSRRLQHWGDVKAPEQPALFLVQGNEPRESRPAVTARRQIEARIYLYVHEKDPKKSPASQLNPLLDALEAALAPDPGEDRQTLGGIVHDCRIAGTIETDEGALREQGLAIVPIQIIV